MEITAYRRHSQDCADKANRYAPRCGCNVWFQFNWRKHSTMLEGKKVRHGQNQWSAETRSFTEAQAQARTLSQKLEALLEGKPARESITVVDAVAKWLKFREQNGDGNTKADLMGGSSLTGARKMVWW